MRSEPTAPLDPTSDFTGHRVRARARFLKAGAEALHDYELLEMALYAAKPRGDTKSLAKRLIKRFGTFAAVVTADPARLKDVEGVGDSVVAALKVIEAAAGKLLQGRIQSRSVIGSWQALLEYCQATMGHRPTEQFRILFLDNRNKLVADEVQQEGTIDHTPVYPREVVKRALDLGAAAMILVHNHPSGDVTPSTADIEITRQIVAAARALGIRVHDHVIIGGGDHASFKTLGLL